MGGAQQPFLYDQEKHNDARFPPSIFDPKAVTRASWESKPPKPKQDGPLISFNRHPDAHEVLGPRRRYKTVGPRTKSWIKALRVVQLGLRVLELVAALGILTMFILLTEVESLTAWVLRITAGVASVHCLYGIYHLWRPAGGRTPASSAAYMLFAGVSDLSVMPLYAYGVMAVVNSSANWRTLLDNGRMREYFIPSAYYTLVTGAGMHFVSLCISLWLGLKFRQITLMPPDMNPLESHLTSRGTASSASLRRHKRNKSSVATSSTASASEKRLSTPLESHRRSGNPYEDLTRPPSMPFSHTRAGSSQASLHSRDSRIDLPSRQYQITPGNSPRNSPRNSTVMAAAVAPAAPAARPMSGGASSTPPPPRSRHSYQSQQSRSSYREVPLNDGDDAPSSTGTGPRDRDSTGSQPRQAKFTEAWYTSESLISRTQQRNRAINHLVMGAAGAGAAGGRRPYIPVNARRGMGRDEGVSDESGNEDDDDEGENVHSGGLYDNAESARRKRQQQTQQQQQRQHRPATIRPDYDYDSNDNEEGFVAANLAPAPPSHQHRHAQSYSYSGGSVSPRPHPLRSNPTTAQTAAADNNSSSNTSAVPRAQTPFGRPGTALSEVSANSRSVSGSGSGDLADMKPADDERRHHREVAAAAPAPTPTGGRDLSKRSTWYGGVVLQSPRPKAPAATAAAAGSNTSSPLGSCGKGSIGHANRNSSIQDDSGFFSKPYGELKPATPPIMVATASVSGRQTSSGNDCYDLGGSGSGRFSRRNVSGKMAEEGRAGGRGGGGTTPERFSRYSALND